MSDETTPSALALSTLAPAASMLVPPKPRHTPRRNAKPKRPPPRHRNAGPSGPNSRATTTKRNEPSKTETAKETAVRLGATLLGALVSSGLGVAAVRLGFHPYLVTSAIGGLGGITAAVSAKERTRHIATGAASAAGSQAVLLALAKPDAPRVVATQIAHTQAPPPTAPIPGRHADLGSLPPGMLDAAFERARAELAVTGDGYPDGYEHDHHQIHHGPVMR